MTETPAGSARPQSDDSGTGAGGTFLVPLESFGPERLVIGPVRRRPGLQRLLDRLPGALVPGRSPGRWFDVRKITDRTWAIHEHRYWQVNSNYLLLGDGRALLVDTGSGLSDLGAVVRGLTDIPVEVLPTHLHFDHIGGIGSFGRVLMADLPVNRGQVTGGSLRPTRRASLSIVRREFRVDEWVPPDSEIDLGGRRLELVATPGHSADGISVIDRRNGIACVGDLLYEGPMLACFPGASLREYRDSLATLRDRAVDLDLLLPGHGPPVRPAVLGPLAGAMAAVPARRPLADAWRPIPLTGEMRLVYFGRRP